MFCSTFSLPSSFFFHSFISLCLCLSLSLSLSVSVPLCLSLPVCLFVCLSFSFLSLILSVDEDSLSSRSLSKVATETNIPAQKLKDKHHDSGRESPKIRRRRPSSAGSSPLHITHTVSSPSLKKGGKSNLASKASHVTLVGVVTNL